MEAEDIRAWAAEAAGDPAKALNMVFIKSQELFINRDAEVRLFHARVSRCRGPDKCSSAVFLQPGNPPVLIAN
ncbi:MAG: hypothetical protein FP824_06770 [Euryarchaeota archaeon]|nr:hypothetical protein [Euryarchaeota archaeon]MBU4071207.1 hypothetical protein [Candidatus Thermoplasmatota archaeon]MBU4144600.1 hypothetical protein [Candidatus Thermoplasmatota archaeon]